MSAYMCSELTLTALATYAVDQCPAAIPYALRASESRQRTIASVFSMLVSENLASLAALYPGAEDRADQCGHFDAYQPVPAARVIASGRLSEPVVVYKLCEHYAYQACEHDGWKASQARTLIDAIRAHAAYTLAKAHGYDAAPWGL